MKQENKKPLYKVLNEQRTQGDWKANGMQIESAGWNVATLNPYAPEISNFEANAQYTALAVNNLHHLAEALETLLEFTDKRQVGYKKAKEALNRIS